MNHQVRGLVFFMLGSRMVKVRQFVKGQFAIAFGFAKQARFTWDLTTEETMAVFARVGRRA